MFTDDPKIPLHLLIFAMETAITTLTCISDMLGWVAFTAEQKVQLCYLYVPYLALCELKAHTLHEMLITAQPYLWVSICLAE